MSDTIKVCVPDIGDFSDVPVVEITVAVGDEVAEGDTLVILESDKATLDVPSAKAGRINEIRAAEGDRVSQGSLILLLEVAAQPVVPTTDVAPEIVAVAEQGAMEFPPPAPEQEPDTESSAQSAHASPSVRKLARTLGVPITDGQRHGPEETAYRMPMFKATSRRA